MDGAEILNPQLIVGNIVHFFFLALLSLFTEAIRHEVFHPVRGSFICRQQTVFLGEVL